MAGSVASHNAENAAARGRNNAIAKNNYIQQKEYDIQANLDNVQYLNDVQEQDVQQDQLYQMLVEQHSEVDRQLAEIHDDAAFKIEDATRKMHKEAYAGEQTGATAARLAMAPVLEKSNTMTRLLHTKMTAREEANVSKAASHRKAVRSSRDLYMDVAFAPTHGFRPRDNTNFESGRSNSLLGIDLAQNALSGYSALKANTAPKATGQRYSMSKSYDRNIERLKTNISTVTAQHRQQNTYGAELRGREMVKHVREVRAGLAPFSKALQDWKTQDIEKQKEQGILEARKAKLEQAKLLPEAAKKIKAIEEAKAAGELAFAFESAEAMDMEHQKLKKQMLDAAGETAYPEAQRIANLSPWQQVGYAQEKLRVFNNSFEDKLAHKMQNSTRQLELSGIKFTPAEIHSNNLAFPMKQAAIEILSEEVRNEAGVDNWSPEMLRLSKTEDVIQKAKDSQISKYRDRYNIESSMGTRQKGKLEWSRSEKTGVNLQKLLLVHSATVDTNGKLLGNAGAWKEVEKLITSEGIAQQNPEYASKILDQPMPASMAKELGVKPGTTFSEQWPGRTASIKKAIKAGYAKEIKDEETYLKAGGTQIANQFIEEARKGDLSTARVNEYKRKFAEVGLPIPSSVTNYETVTMRDEREDKQAIEYLMASNNGYISNEQLDQFHPKAALEFREKATRLEKEALKAHDAPAKIKAHMDTAFTNMGIKANEKSPAYVEAMSNAKADYAEKYNRYVAMGYSSAHASHLALHAQQVTDKETGEVLPDSMGVLTEIRTHGEGNKYVVTGQAIEKEIKPGHLRVARIASGKREIRDDPDIIVNGTIGGDYGRRMLDSVIANVDKYGATRGAGMDKSAKKYYEGLARGRDGNWMGLLDKQLKARGHAGLWPNERPPEQDLFEGRDINGNKVEDPDGLLPLAKSMERASKYPSLGCYKYIKNTCMDARDYRNQPGSIWDNSENLVEWVRN